VVLAVGDSSSRGERVLVCCCAFSVVSRLALGHIHPELSVPFFYSYVNDDESSPFLGYLSALFIHKRVRIYIDRDSPNIDVVYI